MEGCRLKYLDLIKKMGREKDLAKFEKKVGDDQSSKINFIQRAGEQKIHSEYSFKITLPAIQMSEISREDAQTILKSRLGGFIKKPLLLPDSGILSLTKIQKEIIKDYKGAIQSKYLAMMRASFTIINFENSGLWEEAHEFMQKLERKFKLVGKHMYNICRSGYVEGKLRTKLNMLKFESQGRASYKHEYMKYFDDCMEFFPYAIWSNEFSTVEEMYTGVVNRFNIRNIGHVRIFARGDLNITKIQKVADIITEKKLGTIENVDRYKIGPSNSMCITIKKTIVTLKVQKAKKKKRK